MRLAVAEAATNVVVHAYREVAKPDLVHVEASVGDTELRVSVADTGRGLRARDDSPGLGLGLAIIGELADRVEMTRDAGGGLRVVMRFALTANPLTP
jgi:anti-sigma regulatory factor (Ser/Thr protein kinase)